MNPLRTMFFVACLAAASYAHPSHRQQQQQQQQQQQMGARSNSVNNNLKPTAWLSQSELESLPSVDQITLQQLENMPVQQGANLIEKMFHLSQINGDLEPSYTPNPNQIQAYIIKPNGQNVSVNLNQLSNAAKQQPNFGDEEVTIFLTGYPQTTQSIRKATRKLVQAYMQRYNAELQQKKNQNQQQEQKQRGNPNYNDDDATSSEENDWNPSQTTPTGDLIVIDLGSAYGNFENIANLNVDKTGAMIADIVLELAQENDVPEEIIHMIGQGPSAHVAGVAGRHYTKHNGRPVRRITGLDPSKLYAKNANTLTGLARGDADFVDVIHTSTYGMGTPTRCGDVDFYPNGPSEATPGSDNVVEATMRATRYYAESVRPGNEHNFPAVAATSLKQYKNNNGHGKRAYMGIATDYDLQGDYILQVNPHSPFGKNTPAQKQNTYHQNANSQSSSSSQSSSASSSAAWRNNRNNNNNNNNNE